MAIEMTSLKAKEFHARAGDAAILGEDSDVRRQMTSTECIRRFDEVWQSKLEKAIEDAARTTYEEASNLLSDDRRLQLLRDWEQRQFSLMNVPFIAQVRRVGKDHYECATCRRWRSLG
jgi:hypothetical protein